MNNRCRVSEDIRAEHMREIRAEEKQAPIDARAAEIYEQVMGYRKGSHTMDITDFYDSMTDEEFRELMKDFLAIAYGVEESGVRDTRQIDAFLFLDTRIEEWAQREAQQQLED